jgi:hypothetical protein
MRAVNPSLNTGQVADILWRTGWNGTPGGRVTKGLDAYAAVLDALGGTLPSDFGEPNGTRQTAAQLFPTAGAPGVLAPPMGGKATHNLGDTDYWKFDLADISSVNVRVEWYWRLGGLTLLLEAEDPENASVDDMVTASGTSGVITMTGTLGPGRYFLRVAGTAVTAYELSVSVSKAILAKDQFEPNDSFETAKRLEFDSLAHFWEVAVWGPGDYDATLHRQRVPAGVNRDFFELHVPMATDDRISRVSIYHTDRPVDVALFDSSRTLIQNWADVRSVSIDPPAPSTCFLRISAKKPTRYKLGVARWVDPAVLPHQVDQAKVLPDWWKNPRFTLKDGVNYFAVDLEELRERRIAFTPTQEAIKLDLLDMEGHVVRQGSRDALGRLTVETGDLRQGRYLLSLARVEDAKRTAAIALQVAPPQPW